MAKRLSQSTTCRSAAAAAAGDHSAAKQLSAEARALKAAVDEAHAAAAVKIEVANNSSNSAGLVGAFYIRPCQHAEGLAYQMLLAIMDVC